ncbi:MULTISPECIES: HYD1 signature containing ADP-ribosyltransferase family protein [Paenibacillus]|uniref:HYD1 signature containing ADP-ribosyltransferase family protein n=1 Tax=Paenibacillus TaxID=44249 RepID=UPI0033411D90
MPYQGKKYSKYIALDVTGLNVTKGRDSVYVINTSVPLNITGRIMGFGNVPAKN